MTSQTAQPATDHKPLGYSVRSLSNAVTVSEQTIRREIEEGRLRAKRVRGRLVIPAAAVEQWLAAD